MVFSLTAVSFPLLLDRDARGFCDRHYYKRAHSNDKPRPNSAIGWGLIIVVMLIVSILPFFLGLLITLPVYPNIRWYFYRRTVRITAPASA